MIIREQLPFLHSAAAAEWEALKEKHSIASESMDKLMDLVGLEKIKAEAVVVVHERILRPQRPRAPLGPASRTPLVVNLSGMLVHRKRAVEPESVRRGFNWILLGNPGTGESHLLSF